MNLHERKREWIRFGKPENKESWQSQQRESTEENDARGHHFTGGLLKKKKRAFKSSRKGITEGFFE